MRHTGGFALSATSTRSRPSSRALDSASGRGLMPSWSPSGPMSRTSRARMRSLIRGSLLLAAAICVHSWSMRMHSFARGLVGAQNHDDGRRKADARPRPAMPGPRESTRAHSPVGRWPGGGGPHFRWFGFAGYQPTVRQATSPGDLPASPSRTCVSRLPVGRADTHVPWQRASVGRATGRRVRAIPAPARPHHDGAPDVERTESVP